MQVSEEEGFISVIPSGFQASWNAGWCCGAAVSLDLDDVGYGCAGARGPPRDNASPSQRSSARARPRLPWGAGPTHYRSLTRAIVEFVQERTCVDPDLVFASGFSNGGFMSYRLACEASDLVRRWGTRTPPPRRTWSLMFVSPRVQFAMAMAWPGRSARLAPTPATWRRPTTSRASLSSRCP